MIITMNATMEDICSAKYINPMIASTQSVFEMMLDCTSQRTAVGLRQDSELSHDVNAMIRFSGEEVGALVFGLPQKSAFQVLSQMVGMESDEINSDVMDAVGELVNMIAGGAKTSLDNLSLSIDTPVVVPAGGAETPYPGEEPTICVQFDSQIGPFELEFAFTE